jgi:hypothetical protein
MSEDPSWPGVDTEVWQAAEAVWAFHQLGHDPVPAEVIIALGCHDIGVADVAADLYAQGLAPLIVATGGDHPATRAYLGDGEARAYRTRMIARGVRAEAILTEEDAKHTGENVTNSRDLLAAEGIKPAQILIACMPYMERRAFATCRSQWPEVDLTCISSRATLGDYLDLMWRRDGISAAEIIANTVGDLDRVFRYPTLGYAIEQPQPPEILHAFDTLVAAGYGTKLLHT